MGSAVGEGGGGIEMFAREGDATAPAIVRGGVRGGVREALPEGGLMDFDVQVDDGELIAFLSRGNIRADGISSYTRQHARNAEPVPAAGRLVVKKRGLVQSQAGRGGVSKKQVRRKVLEAIVPQ
jgi:hypothetical protein